MSFDFLKYILTFLYNLQDIKNSHYIWMICLTLNDEIILRLELFVLLLVLLISNIVLSNQLGIWNCKYIVSNLQQII